MRLPRPRRRWLVPAALVPLLLLTCGPSADATFTVPPAWPGLPATVIPDGWDLNAAGGAQGNGLSEVARARQWVKIPAQAVAAQSITTPVTRFPADDPQDRLTTKELSASVFLSSPAGAKHGYGVGLPTTVHTVAFGAIPIQVGVQLEQLRDASDLPVPLQVVAFEVNYRHAQPVRPGVTSGDRNDFTLSGKVRVRLTSLSVDGVDVGLGDCISAPIALHMQDTMWKGDPETDPTQHGYALGSLAATNWLAARGIGSPFGGAFTGEIDIPAFSHCLTTTGEDLSPLLTDAISGPGNPVKIGSSSLQPDSPEQGCMTKIPEYPYYTVRAPFSGDPSDCDPSFGPPTLDYPARDH